MPVSRDLIGRSHPLVARVRRLSRSAAERQRSGRLVIEGIRAAEEALREQVDISDAVISPRLRRDDRGRALERQLRSRDIRVHRATDRLLTSLHDAVTHQGVLLIARRPSPGQLDSTSWPGPEAILLVACGIQDPGNLGALVRVVDAAGGHGLVAVGGADPYGPKAVRASAGSAFRLPIHRFSDAAAIAPLAHAWRSLGARLVGAVPAGGSDYRRSLPRPPAVLFIGSEAAGLPEPVLALLDGKLTIPINPRVESINATSAAAVLLFAIASRGSAEVPPWGPSDRPHPEG